MLSVNENKYWIWISTLNLKNDTISNLLKIYKNPQEIFNLSENELKKCKIMSNKQIAYIIKNRDEAKLEEYINYMKKHKIEIITIDDKEYPEKLKNIYERPLWLYYIGNIKLINEKNIAVVGSRKCTSYGKKVAFEIARKLYDVNVNTVSGLAYGIDSYAHSGSISEKAKTIAVLGNGLDIIYPKQNANLASEIIKKGGLILSEYIIGTKPEKQNFPERNRIISGIADSIVVVEAEEKSGSLITVNLALEQGKEIFAIPGNIYSKNSKGTNEIIKDGARIITSVDSFLEEI